MFRIEGMCIEPSNGSFFCSCPAGWQDKHCEKLVDLCTNVTCLHGGVCRASLLNYTCECLGESYSGRHCEVVASAIGVHQAVSRSFASVAIAMLTAVALFIIIMDVLKYGFGIDVAGVDPKKSKSKKQTRDRIGVRFIYVNAPVPSLSLNAFPINKS